MNSSNVITTTPTTDLATAVRLMRENGIHHLVVVDHGQVAGVLSDRDIWARGFAADGLTVDAQRLVGETMAPLVDAITEESELRDAVEAMRTSGASALPILRAGELVGIVTESDVIYALHKALHAGAEVEGQRDVDLRDPAVKAQLFLGRPLMQNFLQLLGEAGI